MSCLIAAAERAGIFIPRFCWHKRMDPVGACRMCLVDVEGSPPIPGTRSGARRHRARPSSAMGWSCTRSSSSEQINTAQKTILELLLINHPLDCPICDRGGECPLQDQVQDYGPAESKFLEPKRRFRKPVPISPLINLDRERCILCYRCTRFCEELSGDVLIGVMDRGPEAFIFPFYSFATSEEQENGHGNGPRRRARTRRRRHQPDIRLVLQWQHGADLPRRCVDEYGVPLQVAAVGPAGSCRRRATSARPAARSTRGCVYRTATSCGSRPPSTEETNEEWLCDKGRYGNAYLSAPDRLKLPLRAQGRPIWYRDVGRGVRASSRKKLRPILDAGEPTAMIIGESLCDEDAYTAQKFARVTLRTNNVDHRIEGGMDAGAIVQSGRHLRRRFCRPISSWSSRPDLREELPILFLRMRIAARQGPAPGSRSCTRARLSLAEYASVRCAAGLPGDEASVATSIAGGQNRWRQFGAPSPER